MWAPIVILLAVILVSVGLIGYFTELKDWNNGSCPKCGRPWHHFDNDSQGGRGYTCYCHEPNETIWISYPIDRQRPV